MSHEKEKRTNEALRARKAKLNSLETSTVGHAPWNNRALVDSNSRS